MKDRFVYLFELLFLLVQKELKVRYKSSFLGYLWALANPFAFALVYYIAFKIIMRVHMHNYSLFLLSGMFPWVWFANSIVNATNSYRSNSSLVKKVNMPRAILPLSNVVHEMVHFCFAVPIILLFIYIAGEFFHISWLWQIPLSILIQILMIYPIALIFALANVFVHDVEYLVGIGLSMLFFLTPIVYPITMVPVHYQTIYSLSPITQLILLWRGIFLDGVFDVHAALYCILVSIVLLMFSYWIYRRKSAKIGELL